MPYNVFSRVFFLGVSLFFACRCSQIVNTATLKAITVIIFANKAYIMVKKKNASVTIDDVHNETIALFHRLIQRLEKLTLNCEDPGTINQALKTTADFLVKLNKERDSGESEEIGSLLQQTLRGIEQC